MRSNVLNFEDLGYFVIVVEKCQLVTVEIHFESDINGLQRATTMCILLEIS